MPNGRKPLREGFKLKEITLLRGEKVLVDDDDYEYLQEINWRKHGKYAVTSIYNKKKKKVATFYMHKMIMRAGKQQIVDHVNRDTLDNRKENLRYATHQQNRINMAPYKNKSSKYKGVSWKKPLGKWQVFIQKNRKQIAIGYFDNEEEAALAYNKKAKELYGEFAYLNEIRESED